MREFIRHPITVPIDYRLENDPVRLREPLKNISQGGLCFQSKNHMAPGSRISIHVSICKPEFESDGVVVWCRKVDPHFEVGISFLDNKSEFCMRMIEQICQIVLYRNEVLEKEGRALTETEAALEWIEKNASHFPT